MSLKNLPYQIPLNGSDYFQLVLDKHQLLWSSVGNVGRFKVVLEGTLNSQDLKTQLLNNPLFEWITSLHLKPSFPFKIPVWQKSKVIRNTITIWDYIDDEDLLNSVINRPVDLKKDALFQVDILTKEEQTILIFSFHHALMDSRGAETFVRLLGKNLGLNDLQNIFLKEEQPLPLVQRLNHAKAVKSYLLWDNRMSPSVLATEKTKKNDPITYNAIHFSQEETIQIAENCKTMVRFGKSPFYLAATTLSFDRLLKKQGRSKSAFWIPVPQDQRKKGAYGPLLGNHVSFLFYRLFPKNMENIRSIIASINEQMMQQIRARIPQSYRIMMDLFRHLPLPIYYNFMKSPTKGALSSFFFSDTGTSMEGFDDFLGLKLKEATHYPPGAVHPGLTVVFSEFRARLKVMVVYNEALLSKSDFAYFEQDLRNNLLVRDAPKAF